MARESREVWAKRVERWQDSGLTAREFAAELGVNYRTLRHWKYQLAKGNSAPTPSLRQPADSRPKPEPLTFVAAQVRETSTLEVQVADVVLRLPVTIDAKRLSELIGAVRSA